MVVVGRQSLSKKRNEGKIKRGELGDRGREEAEGERKVAFLYFMSSVFARLSPLYLLSCT